MAIYGFEHNMPPAKCKHAIRYHTILNPLRIPNHPAPDSTINHSTHPKRRHNSAHPSQTAPKPISPHLCHPRPPRRAITHGSIIQIQPPQMQRRTEELNAGRRQELRHAGPADGFFQLPGHWQQGRDERREVERRENRQAIPRREERVAGLWDRPRHRTGHTARAKHARELTVFVQAEGHVDARRGEEFRRPRGDGLGGGVGDCAADGVDAVGCGVGAEVEG